MNKYADAHKPTPHGVGFSLGDGQLCGLYNARMKKHCKNRWFTSLNAPAMMGMVLMMGLGVAGCTQRTIHVTTEPDGALVYLNDEEVGRTPVSVPFTHYGVYDVRLEKEGYQPVWTQADAVTPWWDYIGLDLFAELIPGSRSDVKWHFPMTPKGEDNPEALLERAGELRNSTRQR